MKVRVAIFRPLCAARLYARKCIIDFVSAGIRDLANTGSDRRTLNWRNLIRTSAAFTFVFPLAMKTYNRPYGK